jgi:cysteine desulfuration protein SufE
MDGACVEKIQELKRLFSKADSLEAKYQIILAMGKRQPRLGPEDKTEKNRVFGCQSTTYLRVTQRNGRCYFDFESDALISAGLGQLLSFVYSGATPQEILSCPPQFLNELGIQQSLTMGRAQGLASMYEKLRQETISKN